MATVNLTWTLTSADETAVNVYRSESPIDLTNVPAPLVSLPAGTESYDDTTAVGGTLYYYVIGAANPTGETFSIVDGIQPEQIRPPGVPNNVVEFTNQFTATLGAIPAGTSPSVQVIGNFTDGGIRIQHTVGTGSTSVRCTIPASTVIAALGTEPTQMWIRLGNLQKNASAPADADLETTLYFGRVDLNGSITSSAQSDSVNITSATDLPVTRSFAFTEAFGATDEFRAEITSLPPFYDNLDILYIGFEG